MTLNPIVLQVRFINWMQIDIVRFRSLGLVATRFRRLLKRQLREFLQQIRMRRHHQ
jgi:hypothetical protein